MEQNIFTADYFIQKFTPIPEKKWVSFLYDDNKGGHCAFGHCGVIQGCGIRKPIEQGLIDVFMVLNLWPAIVNDGEDERYQQPTPKQRILAALYDIKKLRQSEARVITKYVAVKVRQNAQLKLSEVTN